MPRSAIMTGAVDFVLPIEKMPEALIKSWPADCLDAVTGTVRRQSRAGLVARNHRASAREDRA